MDIFKVTLGNGIQFDCSPDQTILEGANTSGISLEYSCKNGRCGVCKAQIVSGHKNLISRGAVSANFELGKDEILTCSAKPKSDLHLDINDLGDIGAIKAFTLPCRIHSLRKINDDICLIVLRLPPNSPFRFLPGQYIDIIKGDIRRSYSIANSPRDDNLIEVQIKNIQGGVLSHYFFNEAAENDLLRIEGPLGTFSLREDESKTILFMATGTGIAPIKALLESSKLKNMDKNVVVVWGGRTERDFYLDLDCIDLEFRLVRVLSRVGKDGFYSGYVQNAVIDLGIDLSSATCYACGSIEMINDASMLLLNQGLDRRRFYSDAFVSSD